MIELYFAATPNGLKLKLFLEEAGLPEGGAQGRGVEEQLLEHPGPRLAGRGEKLAGLFGQVDQDRRRLGQGHRAELAVGIDDHWHLGVGIERKEGRRLLLALAHIDGVQDIGQSQLLQCDGDLHAVGRGEGVDVEHAEIS